jgi:hypothetical protein
MSTKDVLDEQLKIMGENVDELAVKHRARLDQIEKDMKANQEVIDDYLISKKALCINGNGIPVTGASIGHNGGLKSDVGFAI